MDNMEVTILREIANTARRMQAAGMLDGDDALTTRLRKLLTVPLDDRAAAMVELEQTRKEKDQAYYERNVLVAMLARLFHGGQRKSAIEGWSPDWHGCVYVDIPTIGQCSWHYHDSQSFLFERLPPYQREWDGHTTKQKYERLIDWINRMDGTTL